LQFLDSLDNIPLQNSFIDVVLEEVNEDLGETGNLSLGLDGNVQPGVYYFSIAVWLSLIFSAIMGRLHHNYTKKLQRQEEQQQLQASSTTKRLSSSVPFVEDTMFERSQKKSSLSSVAKRHWGCCRRLFSVCILTSCFPLLVVSCFLPLMERKVQANSMHISTFNFL